MNSRTISIVGAFAVTAGLLAAAEPSVDTKQVSSSAKPATEAPAKPAAAVSDVKLQAIRRMLAVSGTVAGNVEGAKEAIKGIMKNSPGVSPKFWEELTKSASQEAFEHILIQIYDRNYTLDEIKDLTRFYESPTGKVFLERNGKVLTESGRVLQAYMESNSKALMKKYAMPDAKAGAPKK